MNILGIMVGTNSTAALLKDGCLVACASEERFLRKKNIGIYPSNAVEYCLKEAALNPSDIDIAVFDSITFNYHHWVVDRDGTFSVQDWVREQQQYWKPLLYDKIEVDYYEIFKDKIIPEHYTPEIIRDYIRPGKDIRPLLLRRHLGDGIKKIENSVHYESHHYYGYYMSPFREEKVLSFVIEGWGDGMNASVGIFANGVYKELYKTDLCNIGRLYRYVTLMLGMKPNEHEYKVMGLAGYNTRHQLVWDILADTLYVDGCNFKYRKKPTDHYFWFKERFEGCRFDEIAGGVQKYIETLICDWIRNWIVKTGVRRIVVSGGVAMNIKAMMEVAKLDEVDKIFVAGTGSDESTTIGACYRIYVFHCMETGKVPAAIPLVPNLYLGPAYSHSDIDEALEAYGGEAFIIIKNPVTADDVAKIIAGGNPIARFSGRMEFGARALGNRSILADPRNLNVIRKINQQIKSRDFWMPFAPVVTEERSNDYLLNPKNIQSPHMAIGFETKPLANRDLIAALHQGDLTARPQILEESTNPGYYGLIKAFERLTGVGGLVNTSFNLHGEPIVNTPQDALHVFMKSGLEYLILEDILIYKNHNKS
ncbi:MAG: carbamoyl transferase [Proteobacteria bacterium]|nr:carbamoyl transferase [Pseudomonadota bacterium]